MTQQIARFWRSFRISGVRSLASVMRQVASLPPASADSSASSNGTLLHARGAACGSSSHWPTSAAVTETGAAVERVAASDRHRARRALRWVARQPQELTKCRIAIGATLLMRNSKSQRSLGGDGYGGMVTTSNVAASGA